MKGMTPPSVERIIEMAIEEDVGRGDVTTRLTVPDDATGSGEAVAKQNLVMSGGEVFAAVMSRIDPAIETDIKVADGGAAKPGDVLIEASGRIASLLMAERVALNFLQRLCGVATLTRSFVEKLPKNCNTAITDTRKTSPGMRFLERQAVLHGGGRNHRVDLAGGILIKENHIAAAGSIAEAVSRCRKGAPHPLRIEAEVRSEQELNESLDAGVDSVLLDNMSLTEIQKCAAIARGRAFIEVSGGIDLDSAARVAAIGVDAISVGALTHSSPSSDISFLLKGLSR